MGEKDSLTIYWKVPDGFDSNKPFYVVHFDALNRNYDKLETELSQNTPDLLAAKLVTVNGTDVYKRQKWESYPGEDSTGHHA